MTTAAAPDLAARRLREALQLIEEVNRSPRAARDRATALVDADRQDEAACVALRALGLAHSWLGDVPTARATLRRSVALGERKGYRLRTSQARTSLLVLLAEAGNTQAALAEATLAEAELASLPDGKLELARLQVNLGLVLQRIGRTAESLACHSAAERVLREHGDARWEAIMLNNRGILLAYRGNHAETKRDLTRAKQLASDNGFKALYHRALCNIGFAAVRAGDLPGALRGLDEARLVGEQMGRPIESVLSDRADALLAAGLAEDARHYAEQAAEGHDRNGFVLNAAEARLSAANAALAAGDAAAAAQYAHAARIAFTRQRRPNWASWARSVEHAARFAAGERSARILQDIVRNTAQLEQAGWLVTPQESKLLAARTALAIGRTEEAAELFTQVASARNSGPARLRVVGWEAEAALRESRGDAAGAGRAVDRGLRVAADYVATLGATDLRTGATLLGANLAATGLRLALSGGSARQVLVRAEQWRAASLQLRPVRPPDDAAFAERLGRLRAVMMQISDEGLAGKSVRGLQTERVRLEQEVKESAQWAPGGKYAPQPRLDLTALSEKLGERVLVEYVRVEDSLHAVSLVDGRSRHYHLGSYKAVLSEFESLRFSLGRMAKRYGSPAVQQAAQAAYAYARRELDDALVRPLAKQIGDRPLVLVPTGSLHALAWPVLPSLTGRQLTVSPSARSWLTAATGQKAAPQGQAGGQVVLAHGPGLPHAEAEIRELARRYPLANPLIGANATARTVAEALDGAQLAHIASHGRFRSDNPLFSSLELADGPLTVYDLEGMRRAPAMLVLSACDTALGGIRPGDELMGVASAVFALGTRTLIASVAPVGDEETRALMNLFHIGLGAGLSPTQALVSAQKEVPDARGFVCFGAG
ncbi:MAG TPA: CHAT domain-containing tetratricopeptide repeat protein [Actinocrinis sp.]|uniref:CHAT domain-containing protein n=1 Tax=Actinocrinis sp. TaxID=1920516 RepID=UPI002DDC9034|nr:CHAT domain-containing tetratricopeptide repeat protein [Actinocrinis sp.]HEV2346820.1 CHAT domain-containing tetratricopeptide repeat protein [Actinocrinis sp.]